MDLDVTRLTFIERTVRSHQLTGEHLLGEQHLVDWSLSASKVDRHRAGSVGPRLHHPDRSRDRRVQSGGLVRRSPFGHPDVQRSGREQLRGAGQLPAVPRGRRPTRSPSRSAEPTGPVDRDADSRAFDITNRSLSVADRAAVAGADLRRALRPGRAAVALPQLVRWTVRRPGPAERRLCPGRDADRPRLRLIGGARVEHWKLDLNSLDPQGRPRPSRATTPTSSRRCRSTTT